METLSIFERYTRVAMATLVIGLLAGCGGGEEAAETPDATVDTDTAVAEQAQTTEVEETAVETSEEETLEVVEESAAEPEETGEEPIVLARADTPAETIDFKFDEGTHYTRLVPTQPTVGGADKVEVVEVFWYGCPHCLTLEPYLSRWEETKPASVRFVRMPAMWNEVLRTHAQLFYTEQELVRNGTITDPETFRAAVFSAYHSQGNRLLSESAIKAHFERFGVSEEAFDKAWNSFEVNQQMRKAADLTRRYGVASVPAVIVNGKFRTGGQQAGGYDELIDVIDELIVRESAR
jgi:thiol:disulfide interchange protein DsbA